MESNNFNTTPPPDFGEEAKQQERNAKRKKMTIIKIAILITGLSALAIVFAGKTEGLSFSEKSKKKSAKKENKNSGQEAAASAAITITKKWEMPNELTEISGLSYMDEQRFACVQDELGTIFIYNIT